MNFCLHFLLLATFFLCTNGQCPSFCRFRFCSNLVRDGILVQNENRVILLGVPNAALGPFPCLERPGRAIGLFNVSGGEAVVSPARSSDPFVPISSYLSGTVNPSFRRRHFRWVLNDDNGRPSIARRPSQGNQERHLNRLCVRMPIRSYDILRRNGSLRRRVRTSGRRACVGFQTQVVRLAVDFEWSSTNDFDLRLQEPNGFEINRFGPSRQSPNGGRLLRDVGSRTCNVEFGREIIRYLLTSTVERGVYTVRVNHQRECERESRYKLRVVFNGRIILDKRGVITEVGSNVVVETFTIR